MMTTLIQLQRFRCDICKTLYNTKTEALSCESQPISHDMGIEISDVVLVVTGDRMGEKARVISTWIIDKYWGHYAWERYWHTVGLSVEYIDGHAVRMLTYDDFERVD
jgi:hypothetical protein